VLLAGGSSESTFFDGALDYDPTANTWSPAGNLSAPRRDFTLTPLPSGQVLAVGGSNGTGPDIAELASADLYTAPGSSGGGGGPPCKPHKPCNCHDGRHGSEGRMSDCDRRH